MHRNVVVGLTPMHRAELSTVRDADHDDVRDLLDYDGLVRTRLSVVVCYTLYGC